MPTLLPKGPPAYATIRDKQNRKWNWTAALAELIDNSVGNGGTNVDVELSPHTVLARDNGVGCTPEMFAALVSLGWHEEDEEADNAVSRYGVGAKDAMLWFGGRTVVASVREGHYQMTDVDWESFRETFDYELPVEGEAAKKLAIELGLGDHGVVVYAPEHRRQMHASAFADVHKTLGSMFWAAVETGATINVTYCENPKRSKAKKIGGPLPGKPMPEMLGEMMDQVIQLADGKTIRLLGGVVSPSVRMSSPGFEYIYGHRVVIEAGGVGSGGMDFERLYVRVFLIGDKEDWNVTTNKSGLHDSDEAALEQAVFDACKGVLELAGSQAVEMLHDNELMNRVSEGLTEAARRHAKRNPKTNQSGAVEPTGDGAEHQQAKKVHPRRGKYRHTGDGQDEPEKIKTHITEFDDDTAHLCGKASIRDRIVRFNKRHPTIATAVENKNVTALDLIAKSLWSDAWTWEEPSGQLRSTQRGEFVAKMSAMLKVT
jgi:hypothetical protein